MVLMKLKQLFCLSAFIENLNHSIELYSWATIERTYFLTLHGQEAAYCDAWTCYKAGTKDYGTELPLE